MWHSYRFWCALGGVVFGGWLIYSALATDRSTPVSPEELPEMVFVDRQTGELFVGQARPTPAAHPQTGALQLMPGWYCPSCQTWHAGPAFDQMDRLTTPVLCPKTRTPLLREGPRPASATAL